MSKNKYVITALFAIVLIIPAVSFAQNVGFPYFGQGGILPCTGSDCNFCNLIQLVQRVTYFAMTIAVTVVAPIFIAIGGILMMIGTSTVTELGGKKEKISQGRKYITGALMGVVIVLGAFVIVNTFYFVVGLGVGGVGTSWQSVSCV